jgi:hypothetical protein
MLIDRHSGARATLADPEPRNTVETNLGTGRCSWFPGLPSGHPGMTILVLIGFLMTLLSAGCADTGASDEHSRDGIYGGVSAGGARP